MICPGPLPGPGVSRALVGRLGLLPENGCAFISCKHVQATFVICMQFVLKTPARKNIHRMYWADTGFRNGAKMRQATGPPQIAMHPVRLCHTCANKSLLSFKHYPSSSSNFATYHHISFSEKKVVNGNQ